MKLDVIQARLREYAPKSKTEEENAFKEICQEIALAGLARAKFFHKAAFQGGTCLRIIHGLKRFSEDLDFILSEPDLAFEWAPLLQGISLEFQSFGLNVETHDRSKAPDAVKNAFLKEDSFGQVLSLRYGRNRSDSKKVTIKLEIDTNPPAGSTFETHFLTYPYSFSVATQDLPSLFAGKCHALLCRKFVKGRDWFDFLWYVSKKTPINLPLLEQALKQQGPYQVKDLSLSKKWLVMELQKKIQNLDWREVVSDVEKFIPLDEVKSLDLWGADFFDYHCRRLAEAWGL